MKKFKEHFDVNKIMWDSRVETHVKSDFYQVENFLKGKDMIEKMTLEGLGDVKGKSILHLQCHFGQDSLSLARMGAKITALDFSGEALKKGRAYNEKLGLDVRFVEANVYDIRDHIEGQFDIVFASFGAICWLPDLVAYAEIINHYLKPGGHYVLAEFHPTLYLFDFDKQKIGYDYFEKPNMEPEEDNDEGTYTDGGEQMPSRSFFWPHSLQEIFTAFISQKLSIESFKEYHYSPWNCFPNMKETGERQYVYGDFGVKIPHTFVLKVRKSND